MEIASFLPVLMQVFILKALLFYNGISYDESERKDALVSLVRSKLFSIDDEEVDDWVPPGDHEIQWKSPVCMHLVSLWTVLYILVTYTITSHK